MSGKSVSQYALYSIIFSSVINRELHESISTIKPAISENTECTIIKVHTPVIDIKSGCVAIIRCNYYPLFHFVSLPAL